MQDASCRRSGEGGRAIGVDAEAEVEVEVEVGFDR
jgi:hypothetical protein